MTPDPWDAVTAARVPAAAVAALGPVRARSDVRVHRGPEVVWVTWPAGRGEVVRCLLPVPGAEFYTHRDGQWYRFGRRVPTADGPPAGDGVAVAAAVVPARFTAIPPDEAGPEPLTLRIVRGGEPRPVTALSCSLADLLTWADMATTAEIEAVRAARGGDRVILLASGGREHGGPHVFRPLPLRERAAGRRPAGEGNETQDRPLTPPRAAGRPSPSRGEGENRGSPTLARSLPVIPGAVRYWGDDLLIPVGYRPAPDLSPAAIRAAVGAAADELVLLDHDGAAIVPVAAFDPLTRAGVRLAARGAS